MEAAEGGAPPPKPPQIGEGQDVLARWTDGLLYLGVVKKVDASRRGCQIQFEDNSQFFVLWKDISPAAAPGGDPACCVCAGDGRNPENSLVRCGKCGHAYHQRCHVPPAPGGAGPWSCRRCVFAVATKRGGALRRGPQARAMLRMKSVLPYALGALDWDPPHLHNLQHCYCYCGGPGQWNLKMLQCRRCRQWFHEACTQCLTRPLLYGDRFYVFECSVCRGGAESVRRLPLRWVDVAHLLLYHLSVCWRRKYFDLEREILPFANRHWHALRLGTLSATPRSQRQRRLLGALSSHKDRFVSGREMKKRRGLFGLQSRAPPPLPPGLGDPAHCETGHAHCETGHAHNGTGHAHEGTGHAHSGTGHAHSGADPAHSGTGHAHEGTGHAHSGTGHAHAPGTGHAHTETGPAHNGTGGDSLRARRRPSPRGAQAPPGGRCSSGRSRARTQRGSLTPDPDAEAPPIGQPPPPGKTPPPGQTPPPGEAPPPRVLARRVTLDGTVQYLLEWGGGAAL